MALTRVVRNNLIYCNLARSYAKILNRSIAYAFHCNGLLPSKVHKSNLTNGTLLSINTPKNLFLNLHNATYHSLAYRCSTSMFFNRQESTATQTEKVPKVLTRKDKFKKAVGEYGSIVIVFHVSISLVSLGICYILVATGLDLATVLETFGLNNETTNKLATNAGTFVVAYAIHKVFAPARVGITLTATPFIVRYLRNIGWLRK